MSLNKEKRRVVITGMGVVSPFGQGTDCLINNILAGNCSIKVDEEIRDRQDVSCFLSSKVPTLDYSDIASQKIRFMSNMSLFAYRAVEEAITNAGFVSGLPPEKTALFLGSTTSSYISWIDNVLKYTERRMDKFTTDNLFNIMNHTALVNVAHSFKLKWSGVGANTACSTGVINTGYAYLAIKEGIFDNALCGGTEEFHVIMLGLFNHMTAVSDKFNDDPNKSCRPFDANRCGIVCAEGCGMLFLETLDSALSRNVKIYGEIVGFGTNTEINNMSYSSKSSIKECMSLALENANLDASEIDFVNAHATGTIVGDAEEAQSIGEIFGDNVWTNSLKGYIGHTMAASGSIELIAILKMMENGKFAGTLNLENVDAKCSGIKHFSGVKNLKVTTFIKNSLALGGSNASLIVRKIAGNNILGGKCDERRNY
ncbi:MAG: beta-ketoacyl-[acyl-carrier-protein] synthase family protein [Elusimicrobiota bacterium]|jgi:3-oxoacyl-[acyl-carrier-protein] synthase II|nr:beta-ketoacyl-[acyl-carrier-protein] synthase family protein [Elusimicrobiota bacterium]